MDDAVIDAPEVEELGGEVEETGQELEVEGQELATEAQDDPYTTKFSREYRAALKAMETAHPESAKYLKQARDNHARLFALTQLEPKGIDGVRERYALLDSLAVGDVKGTEAISAMQERIQATDQVDQMLAAGDPKALESLGPDFDSGLAKLAPTILDRVMRSNPEAYQAAIQPHIVESLKNSDLVQNFNALVDILNTTNDPRLDDKAKMAMTIDKLGKMGQWLNSQSEKATTLPQASQQPDKLAEERTAFDKERQDHHWDTQIKPQAVQHENAKFEELFKPYNLRLKLDAGAKTDLMQSFKAALGKAGSADAEYQRQMKIYRAQKNPDPTAVTNFVKNSINKHSKTVMETLIKARYSPFLSGKPKAVVATAAGTRPAAPNVEIRSVKPPMSEIDHRNTPVEWLAMKQYRLNSGKVIQVRA